MSDTDSESNPGFHTASALRALAHEFRLDRKRYEFTQMILHSGPVRIDTSETLEWFFELNVIMGTIEILPGSDPARYQLTPLGELMRNIAELEQQGIDVFRHCH